MDRVHALDSVGSSTPQSGASAARCRAMPVLKLLIPCLHVLTLSCVCRHPSSLFSTTSQPAYSSHSFLDCHVIQMEHNALMKLDMHAGDMLLLLCCVRWIVQCQMHIQGDKTSLRALKAISALSMAISEEAVAACR